jgi:molybdopterin synthase catalytic subunit
MRVTVKLFAVFRDIVGQPEVELELREGGTVGEAWERLKGDHERLAGAVAAVLFAVNKEIVEPEFSLEGDEVAFLPPVSGGGGV